MTEPKFEYGGENLSRYVISIELCMKSTARCLRQIQQFGEEIRWLYFDITYGPWIGAAVIFGSLALAWAGAAWGTR